MINNILDGSKQLLTESVELLGELTKDVVIVGGWGPYLRHPDKHPGTKDVDILFPASYSKETITKVLEDFLNNGFFISAKHDFQLCKAYRIGKRTYIYNVDLLHPTEGKINKVDFVEIMDLDVTTDGIKVKTIISVNIQYGDVIYNENLFEIITFENKSFNVLDGAGIVISKINSCHNKKRERDIYDIYISLTEPKTLDKLNHLKRINPKLAHNLNEYADKLKNDWKTHQNNLRTFGVNDSSAYDILRMAQD